MKKVKYTKAQKIAYFHKRIADMTARIKELELQGDEPDSQDWSENVSNQVLEAKLQAILTKMLKEKP